MNSVLNKITLVLLCSLLVGCIHHHKCMPDSKNCSSQAKKCLNEDVILVHGFARSSRDMRVLAKALRKQGYNTHQINYLSIRKNINNIQSNVFKQMMSIISNNTARKIHLVGHSLGGLLVRSYLAKHSIPNMGFVVIIGSPNKGTNFVDYYKQSWWFKWFGDITHIFSAKQSAFLNSLPLPNYTLGVIAGNFNSKWQEHILPGPDDGLVPVKSTKIKGMKDFIIIENTLHRWLIYKRQVIDQVIYFLSHGRFNHKQM